ncbi:CubicO group peptidase, beta-lactamase class C family [Thermomonospora echinospora]|uniref:CubicO group peptidase, beta-lactamase class C family n=1 Tax=Thermomonospora echinospora TaxID=1992 RepID=A0A1H6E4N2_9ACTN|nr:serine hydrolase domain-containing protein [Thermomonospora echinospora]SEG92728.1 CubicO group peptidase, beta-lactamase class C family [Thermomonospora echinospora]
MSAVPAQDPRVVKALDRARELGEEGLQVAAYLGGDLIVDAWAGSADPQAGRQVDGSTLFNVFSVTKAITATALHILAERGLVDYRAPVCRYWPGFARNGKESITVRDVLSHRAGIPWMPEDVTPERQADWDWMIRAIEDMPPAFEPGRTNSYHALIWGWIVGEIARRADPEHRPVEVLIRQEIVEPLGISDLFLGLPESEDGRVARLIGGDPAPDASETYLRGMPRQVFPGSTIYNTDLARRTVNPGAGAIGNARAFARFFAMLAGHGELDGVRLLPADVVDGFTEPREDADVTDLYLGGIAHVSAFGYWLGGSSPTANPAVGPNPRILHHPGAGGSISWAELDTGLAVSICHNRMHEGPFEPSAHPFVPIAEAVRAIAAERLERN